MFPDPTSVSPVSNIWYRYRPILTCASISSPQAMAKQAVARNCLDFSRAWELSDVVLLVQGRPFHVHRSILAMWSPVFSRMFTADFKEKTANVIPLPGKKANEIEEMLLVIYPTSSKQIDESNCWFLLHLAEEYMMTKLTQKCEYHLINILENAKFHFEIDKQEICLEFLTTAQRYCLKRLQTLCTDKAQDMSFRQLTKHKMYKEISLPNYRKIAEGKIEKMERQLYAERSEVSNLQSKIARNKQEHERREEQRQTGVKELESHASDALRKFENIVYILEFISREKVKETGNGYQQDPVHKQLMKIQKSGGQLQKLYSPLKDLYDELRALQFKASW